MKKQTICCLALILATPLSAQGWLYSPRHLNTKNEGVRQSYYFGGFANGRNQIADGENRQAALITAFNVRRDFQMNYNEASGMGRKWTNVKVSIGEGSVEKFSATFSANFVTTPAVVFNGAWSLPTLTGKSSTGPNPYGGTKGEYRIPFSPPFAYSGKGDIVNDWQFSGGTLENNASWPSSRIYAFDSFENTNEAGSRNGTATYIPAKRLDNNSVGVIGRCNDSAMTVSWGAYCALVSTVYGESYPIDNFRGRLYFYHYSYYTAYESPIVHALALANDTTGVNLGTGCNKLHVKAPLVLVPMVTMPQSVNSSGYSGYRYSVVKWRPALVNAKVTVQAAWADSLSKAFKLSQACEATLPIGPPTAPQRIASYQYGSPTVATGYVSPAYRYAPAVGWEIK